MNGILFDDSVWRVRHVVAETGRWLHSHRVLIAPRVLGPFRRQEHVLWASLTDEEIKHGPPVDADLPVSAARDLRSASHVIGHHVMARDGMIGSVEDFVINDGWSLRDVVVRIHGWPHHESVLVASHWVSRISWAMQTVRIELPRGRFERATDVGALA